MTDNNLMKKLNGMLADGLVFYQKLRHYHWEVQGQQFFRLHEKFEEMYDQWNGWNDDLAERIMTLGGRPVATLKQALEMSSLEEDESVPNGETMVSNLLGDMNVHVENFNQGIKAADKVSDYGTADMLTGMLRDLQKTGWMLRSFLNQQQKTADKVSHERVAAMA